MERSFSNKDVWELGSELLSGIQTVTKQGNLETQKPSNPDPHRAPGDGLCLQLKRVWTKLSELRVFGQTSPRGADQSTAR